MNLSPEIKQKMKSLGIDVDLTLQILENYNKGNYDHFEPVTVSDVPEIDGNTIIDMTGNIEITLNLQKAAGHIKNLGTDIDITQYGSVDGDTIVFTNKGLEELGVQLYPYLSYGVLNGGSASSYVDMGKNKGFNETLYSICEKEFLSLQEVSKGKAKGLTPAFINKDGSHGPSFLELKMRSVLIEILHCQTVTGKKANAPYPMYQMTSVYNNEDVLKAYNEYKSSEMLTDLISETGYDITEFKTGIQPMLAVMTHSNEGKKKSIFLNAHGKENNPLPMPGGHGQCFTVLKDIFRELYDQGKRFVYLGNVDNLGFTVNPVSLALLALKGSQVGFDFAFRTPVDIKGGVLIKDQYGKLNCADIGVAISKEELYKMEEQGKKILFNCATGLFNLEYLVNNNDDIINKLPMRISDQSKDAGNYSQAEQVTWEVIGILDDVLIFGVDKYSRFLAAKLLLEGLMTSGIGLDNPDFPTSEDTTKDLKDIASKLNKGLFQQLETTYGMKNEGSRWVPKSAAELKAGFSK